MARLIMYNTLSKVFICWSIAILSTQLNNEYVCSEHISSSLKVNHSSCEGRPNVSQWNKDNFPNPQTDTKLDYCGRNCKSSWICDPDHILSQEEADSIDNTINKTAQDLFRNCSSCPNGQGFYSISIGVVRQIGNDNMNLSDIDELGSEFSDHLRLQKWKFSPCDSDVVIVLSQKDRLIWLSIGSMVTQNLSSSFLDRIRNETSNMLKSGLYGEALFHVVKELGELFSNGGRTLSYKWHTQEAQGLPSEALIAGIVVFIVIFVYAAFMIRKDLKKTYEKENPSHRQKKRKVYLKSRKERNLSRLAVERERLTKIDTEETTEVSSEQRPADNHSINMSERAEFSIEQHSNNPCITITVTNVDGSCKDFDEHAL
ncbi:uncharacterized protein LOC127725242 [Mytilus californianus]|uniref:uncharacterized protein LOC127725242 n=1 Tax=Mytilus californianus TaxID=6549 RepID=UPI0022485EE2|nr:uncharacterized protein LOC127725242 [Mytilus californianus]